MNDKYNIHTHIFTGHCAPKDFLQVGLKLGDGASSFLKWLFLTKPVSWLITKFGGLIPNKTLQFLKIGVMASQEDVFVNLKNAYDKSAHSGIRIVSLSIDMDYMSDANKKPKQDFDAQIQEVYKLKKSYPNNLFPFYGVDPRNPDTINMQKIVVALKSNAFTGIKLYPPNGFFPFDPRLNKLYEYAQANNIPIMSDCTRGGSYYIGKNVWSVIPDNPASLNPSHSVMPKIIKRIAAYKNASDKSYQENAKACNLFSHPENYLPVLDKYPNLKLCIAHMGGDIEILGSKNPNSKYATWSKKAMILEGCTETWYDIIKNEILTDQYPNTFTDISYSLSDVNCITKLFDDLQSGKINKDRVLFGTDYFMVTKEDAELKVIATAENYLKQYFPAMMSENNKKYLF